jgi:murein DD-endopeptidase MepM/ murein hydrolase activator NlpD
MVQRIKRRVRHAFAAAAVTWLLVAPLARPAIAVDETIAPDDGAPRAPGAPGPVVPGGPRIGPNPNPLPGSEPPAPDPVPSPDPRVESPPGSADPAGPADPGGPPREPLPEVPVTVEPDTPGLAVGRLAPMGPALVPRRTVAPAPPVPIPVLAREAEYALRARSVSVVLRAAGAELAADPGQVERTSRTALGALATAVAAGTGVDSRDLLQEWQFAAPDTLGVVLYALQQVGRPVRYGRAGPDAFDSSGLTKVAWARAGVSLPHYSGAQMRSGPRVEPRFAAPGDLVVFGPDGGTDVGLVVGQGMMVIAAHDAPSVGLASYGRGDLAAVVRPSGRVAPEHRSVLANLGPRPVSATLRTAPPAPGRDPVGGLAGAAVAALDTALRADLDRQIALSRARQRAVTGPVVDRRQALAGIPDRLLPFYQRAARTCPAPDDWWAVLAAIGATESGHGTANGSVVNEDGFASPPLLGPRLDGSGVGGNTTPIPDSDGGTWDGDPEFDRAVGPMQFLPSTWLRYGVRAPERGEGIADPQNAFDAIYSAANYLCAVSGGAVSDPRAALLAYNRDVGYVDSVLERAASYVRQSGARPVGFSVAGANGAAIDTAAIDAAVKAARARLSQQVAATAIQVAERFGLDPAMLVEEWRTAPVGALRAVLSALAQAGGEAASPEALVASAWRASGVALPEDPSELARVVLPIDVGELRPGDLVRFGPGGLDFIGLYVGSGVMVFAPRWGGPAQLDGYDPAGLASFARVPQPPSIISGLGWLQAPVPGAIVSGFGMRADPFSGEPRHHDGLDLAAVEGAPVRASAPGVVIAAGWQGGYGNFVEVDHGNGVTTLSGHLAVISVRVGERLRTGDVVGLVGSTGTSTGPHVHFEVRVGGLPVDPQWYLLPASPGR